MHPHGKDYVAAARFLLLSLGAQAAEGTYGYRLDTSAGALLLEPRDFLGRVLYGRWVEPARADQRGVDCDPHTGAWTTYLPDSWSTAECLDTVRRVLVHTLAGLGNIPQKIPDSY